MFFNAICVLNSGRAPVNGPHNVGPMNRSVSVSSHSASKLSRKYVQIPYLLLLENQGFDQVFDYSFKHRPIKVENQVFCHSWAESIQAENNNIVNLSHPLPLKFERAH